MRDTQNKVIASNSSETHDVKVKRRRRNDDKRQAFARGDGQTVGWGAWNQDHGFFQDQYNSPYTQPVRRRDSEFFWRD